MSKIKLPHTSGNSMSIGAPATNPSGDLEIKLPATIGAVNQFLKNSGTAGELEYSNNLTFDGTNVVIGSGAVESDFAITNRSQPRGIYTEVASIPNDTNILAVEIKNTQDSKTRAAKLGLRKATGENTSGFVYWHQRDGGHSYVYTDNSNNVRVSNNVSNVGDASGTVVGSQTSDIRLKNSLGNISYGLTEINAINPIKFTYKKDTTRQHIGFSAQDVKTIIPEAVYDTKDTREVDGSNIEDVLAMDYVALIPVLVNAVKELSAKVKALEEK